MLLRSYLLLITIMFSMSAFAQVSIKKLSAETRSRLEKVPEFAFIQKEANKLGVKVYLFGGTASAFAHYVRWDLEREAGDDKYQEERFDYDFTNIYRGNQDLDIVVDGTAEQAAHLQQVLKENYPHFVGDREAWEVRLLRAQIGDKLPLLGDEDFKNQHTDTNSTGMILVNALEGEATYKDLRDWENPDSPFLSDVANARIKYLFSKKHEETERFKDEKNPPILSAIRYIAKLTQYEVIGTKKDLNKIKKIIDQHSFDRSSRYVEQKIEEFSLKALLNAPNIEYAWNLLDELGLREKLIEMDDDRIDKFETLSWWMDKEPLFSRPLGEGGKGRTAARIFKEKELGPLIVSHETNSFKAYENITRSNKGFANVFISRQGKAGETAVFGDGFYTKAGLIGAAGTGITIRFKLNPKAREGTDFNIKNDYIIVLNKNALELIPEKINLPLIDFFKLIVSGDLTSNDQGLITKLKRRFDRGQSFSEQEGRETAEFIEYVIKNQNEFEAEGVLLVVDYWFSLEVSAQFKNTLVTLLEYGDRGDEETEEESSEEEVDFSLSYKGLHKFTFGDFPYFDLPRYSQSYQKRNRNVLLYVLEEILVFKHWNKEHELLKEIILSEESGASHLITTLLSEENFSKYPKLVDLHLKMILEKSGRTEKEEFISEVLTNQHWSKKKRFKWLMKILEYKHKHKRNYLAYFLESEAAEDPFWHDGEPVMKIMRSLLMTEYEDPRLLDIVGSELYHHRKGKVWVKFLLYKHFEDSNVLNSKKSELAKFMRYDADVVGFKAADQVMRTLIAHGYGEFVMDEILFIAETKLPKKLLDMGESEYTNWSTHPKAYEWLDLLISKSLIKELNLIALSQNVHFQQHPILKTYVGRRVNKMSMYKALEREDFSQWYNTKYTEQLKPLFCKSVLD